MDTMVANQNVKTVEKAWSHLGAGEMDALADLYAEDMVFVLPGQADVVEGRASFRAALDGIGQALPPGFEIRDLQYFEGPNGVVNLVKWGSDKLPGGSQAAIYWGFDPEGRITEERWFIDTVQWNAAF